MKRKSHLRFYTNLFLTSALAIGGSFSLAKAALAQVTLTRAGTTINNTATGSFDGETSGTSGTATSNIVTLSVLEVTGITVTVPTVPFKASTPQITTDSLTPGPYQTSAEFTKGDIVYFDFTITNTGNSPTAFFIPDTATVTNGTQRGIRVLSVDPDGAGAVVATALNTPVPTGGALTTAPTGFLPTPATNGYIPVNGTVIVRVAVELTGVQVNDKTTVVLGSTVATNADGSNGQNEDYVASGTNRDVYTSDLADPTTIPPTYLGVATIDQTLETAGEPVNGTLTPATAGAPRKEAANNASTSITQGIDYGDLPDASVGAFLYKTKLAFSSGYTNSGASHLINKTGPLLSNQLFLGALVPDAEADGQPATNANGDNTNGTNDEDGVSVDGGTNFTSTMPPLATSATSYSVTVKTTNNTGSNAYLAGWVDFNQNGAVDAGEVVYYNLGTNKVDPVTAGTNNLTLTWAVPTGLTPGVRYARFRLTSDPSVYTGGIGGTGAGTVTVPVPLMTAPLGEGEVEDYVINKVPGFNLVKRITNINGSDITGFVDQTDVPGNNDSDPKWPLPRDKYLRGGVNCTPTTPCNTASGTIAGAKPGDLVEYTIYFLSNGSDNVKNVQLCDRIPSSATAPIYNTTFEPATYGASSGVLFGWDSLGTSLVLPDPDNSTLVPSLKVALANASAFVATPTALPAVSCGASTLNPNGAVLFNIGASTVVPAATAVGTTNTATPINSYGFIRFKVKVN